MEKRRVRVTRDVGVSGPGLAALVVAGLILVLPLMMGHRTPATLTATGLVLTFGAALALLLAGWQRGSTEPMALPSRGWWWVFGLLTGLVFLQVLPLRFLAALFGPYPDALWQHPEFAPRHWSPNPGATLRGWAVFVALFAIAWIVGRLRPSTRGWIWLAIVAMALFQGLYGLVSHASGATTIFGIWERNNVNFVHGSFSNRNLFAGYLALTWPLVVAVWWLRDMPLLSRLPTELRIAGSVAGGAIIGAALMGSASRLGTTAGVVGMLIALLLWTRYRGHLRGGAVWPAWAAAFAAFLFATWYGLAPLTERLAITTMEEGRFQVFALMFADFPRDWWFTGVGLGAFEAVFKQIQPGDLAGWWDYAHNDLLQWVLETGLVGIAVLGLVLTGIVKNAAIRLERIPLYAGLGALVVVGLGDFSWHIPATQVVLAIFLGVILQRPPHRRHPPADERPQRRRHRRRREHATGSENSGFN